ncbi:hypothetical protein [Streptomyces sp. CB03238]|uniref:hypothetical protein n=1 Tax=Streptomyces sp. CB03238 TaxID=1907777 RepID=UPI001F4EFC51|nr:hypothetical protein [Streptomyces sp. CB03238]
MWAAVLPLLPVPAWFQGLAGGARGLPRLGRVYAFFRRWREHGLIAESHDRLRGMDDKTFRRRLDEREPVVAERLPYSLELKQNADARGTVRLQCRQPARPLR